MSWGEIYSLSEGEQAPIEYFIHHLLRSDFNWSMLLMGPSAALSTPSDLPMICHCLPVGPGVFLLLLLLSAGCCCLLRPATHAPLLFRQDTNLQTLLALRSNLSGQGISCPMCSGETAALMLYRAPVSLPDPKKYPNCMLCPAGVFMEKPHPLYTHTSSSAFKFSTHQQTPSATTSNARGSSVRPNLSSNQTGETFST